MSKFNYMLFTGAENDEFVVHSKKYTKDQAVELFRKEFPNRVIQEPEIKRVRYYVNAPEWCGFDNEGGCYSMCNQDSKGSFPVFVFQLINKDGEK